MASSQGVFGFDNKSDRIQFAATFASPISWRQSKISDTDLATRVSPGEMTLLAVVSRIVIESRAFFAQGKPNIFSRLCACERIMSNCMRQPLTSLSESSDFDTVIS